MNRDFKGVWIPKGIWLTNNLGWTEKILLTEIDSLSELGECFATNEYFADFLALSKDRISKIISELSKKGYVETRLIFKHGTKQVEKRIITTRGYRLKQLEGIGENTDTPIGENTEDNNTLVNNTSINTNNIYTDKPKTTKFIIPKIEEVKAYCIERNNRVDAERWIDYYISNGWLVGKNKMKDWKAAVRTWERGNTSGTNAKQNKGESKSTGYDFSSLRV